MKQGHAKIYGVLGNPVGHSLSPAMHNAAFEALDIPSFYGAFKTTDLKGCIRGMRALGISGMSITIPFKTDVMAYLDALDPLAEQIGAVNTIVNENGLLRGYNTDGAGAMKALEAVVDPVGKRCVLVGAGGAARGIGFMAVKNGMKLTVSNRSENRGRTLADFLECPFVPLSEIKSLDTDVLIQTTPVGMFPRENASPVSADMFREGMVVMDAVYNPMETKMLKDARSRGCETIGGLEMFIHQGALQFQLWTGLEAPLKVMRAVVTNALSKSR
ncbi:shikimate dehydrogenase [delta proteobacterium NaphS2]|nr:shikimate dehydrogenase [delta proteobacterium NaphS2]